METKIWKNVMNKRAKKLQISYDIYFSSINVRHPLSKILTPLHYTSPNYTSLHFTTHVDTSLLPI